MAFIDTGGQLLLFDAWSKMGRSMPFVGPKLFRAVMDATAQMADELFAPLTRRHLVTLRRTHFPEVSILRARDPLCLQCYIAKREQQDFIVSIVLPIKAEHSMAEAYCRMLGERRGLPKQFVPNGRTFEANVRLKCPIVEFPFARQTGLPPLQGFILQEERPEAERWVSIHR